MSAWFLLKITLANKLEYSKKHFSVSRNTQSKSIRHCRVFLVFLFPQFSQMSFPDDFWPVSAFPFPKVIEKAAVEIWVGSKIGSVFLTLNCIERKLICFPWQGASRICLSRCILSLLSSTLMLAILLPRPGATSKKSVPFLWRRKAISLLSPKDLLW